MNSTEIFSFPKRKSQNLKDGLKMTISIILSGGIGSRMKMGETPKQYLHLCGRPIISYSLRSVGRHPDVDGMVIVADKGWRSLIAECLEKEEIKIFFDFADPGETRQLSIFNGLKRVRECHIVAETVIIHDAARPLVSRELISRCLHALPGYDGVMPVLSAKDTFYLTNKKGKIVQLLERSALVAGQAPEVFNFEKYYQAHLEMPHKELMKINGSTEIAVLKGLNVVTIEGDERNIKITTPNDLMLAEKYLEEKVL